jgi:MFS transporter, DHA1 family, tetracycline resistance protein
LIGPTITRFGERVAMLMGLLFGIAAFSLWGFAPSALFFFLGIPLMSLWGIANAASMGLMSRRVGSTEQGQLQGANSSLMGIANLFGPGLFTQAFALFVGERAAWHLPGAPFFLAALLLVFAVIVAAAATRSQSKSESHS